MQICYAWKRHKWLIRHKQTLSSVNLSPMSFVNTGISRIFLLSLYGSLWIQVKSKPISSNDCTIHTYKVPIWIKILLLLACLAQIRLLIQRLNNKCKQFTGNLFENWLWLLKQKVRTKHVHINAKLPHVTVLKSLTKCLETKAFGCQVLEISVPNLITLTNFKITIHLNVPFLSNLPFT